MTDDKTSHITLTYRDRDEEITKTYAVSQETLRAAQLWRAAYRPSAKDLDYWLARGRGAELGAKLDRQDGAAIIECSADGVEERCFHTEERYYRDGKLHRENGPAYVYRHADGTTVERYFRDGKRHREDGAAVVEHYAGGKTIEEYYRDGKPHREDGPAIVRHGADGSSRDDGSIYEAYYRNGEFIKEEQILAPLSTISGVTVQPPAPKAPDRPGAPHLL